MSIWASLPGEDITAVNVHDRGADEYAGTGPERIDVHVSTALSWNDRIRLGASELTGEGFDVCLLLDADGAELLAGRLLAAVARVKEAGRG